MQRRSAMAVLRVSAPARLHLGFLDLNGGLGRRYGSLGLAVDRPSTEITVRPAADFQAQGPESTRALRLIRQLAGALALRGRYRVEIEQAIPAHAGLGSGTQLALAIGTALIRLEGLDIGPRALGELVERGARSAIGMAAFEVGGFVVDGGRGDKVAAPPLVAHAAFPEAWRALLILDPKSEGVHGDRETQAFAALPDLPASAAGHLCRLMLMRLLPGLHEHDIKAFGGALTEIQDIVGGYFAAAQGGSPWSSPNVGRLARRMADEGARGIGQSSWGPTGFGFVESEAAAARLYSTLVEDATALGLEILVVCGRNTGARIEFIDSAKRSAKMTE